MEAVRLRLQVPPGEVPGSTIFAQVPQAPGPVQGAVVQAVRPCPGASSCVPSNESSTLGRAARLGRSCAVETREC